MGQKIHEIAGSVDARGIDEWLSESMASQWRRSAVTQLSVGEKGVKAKEASAERGFYRPQGHRKKSSLMSGDRRWRDLVWRAEQWSSTDETWGKRFMRLRGVSMREESMNGYWSRRLASGEGQR
jgi:hypothetical protein